MSMIKAVSLIVNNRTGIREIQLNMDTVLKNDELRYEFFLGNSAKIMTVSYSRNGKKEEINQVMSAFVFLLAVVGISVKPVFRKKLIGIQEEYVREIFPFIFKYPGMQKFRKCFENEHDSYPYDEYDEAKKMAYALMNSGYSDNQWHIVWGDKGTLFVSARWKEKIEGDSIIIMNNRVFYSNRDIELIEQAEKQNSIRLECGNGINKSNFVDIFSRVYPETMLNTYIKGGGTRIFHFLCSKHSDRIFELVAKSGLGVVADQLLIIEKLSLSATKPQDVFGLPMKLLRYINKNFNSVSISTPNERAALLYAWRNSPETFKQSMSVIDVMWIDFLQASKEDTHFKAEILSKLSLGQTLKYLNRNVSEGKMNAYDLFIFYENYVMFSKKLGYFCDGRYPKNLVHAIRKSIDLLEKINERKKNEYFKEVICDANYQKMMEKDGEESYCICAPTSKELVYAGQRLHNCLKDYGKKITEDKTIIGLVYECREKNKNLIGAIEIKNGELIQAKSFCNEQFRGDEREYIIRYSMRKGLGITECSDLKCDGYKEECGHE